MPKKYRRREVPCEGCTLCCRGEVIFLIGGLDDPREFKTVQLEPDIYALRQKENGDCIYLLKHRCKIHHRQPTLCRAFDCRDFAARFDQKESQRLLQNQKNRDLVWTRGNELRYLREGGIVSPAKYNVKIEDRFVCIEDENGERSVTNDAENVVGWVMFEYGVKIAPSMPWIYRDSHGIWDQLLVEDGKFAGFRILNADTKDAAKTLVA